MSHLSSPAPVLFSLSLGKKQIGWAMSNERGHVMSGTGTFESNKFEQEDVWCLKFAKWLKEVKIIMGKIDAVYTQSTRSGVNACKGLLGVLSLWTQQHEITHKEVPLKLIKEHITGNPKTPKKSIKAYIYALGHNPDSDSEALALSLIHISEPTRPY